MTKKDLLEARAKLKANNLEAGLPGREEQYECIHNFLYERLKIKPLSPVKKLKFNQSAVVGNHLNQTIFICGVPGTGKTATVMSAVDNLNALIESSSTTTKNKNKSKVSDSPIHPFKVIKINGFQLTSPDKIYSEMLYQMSGERMSSEKAQDRLNKIFSSDKDVSTSSKSNKKKSVATDRDYTVLLIDELDTLYSERRQSIFYNLFDWPTSTTSKLIVIAIANAMDLPQRFMSAKIMSRLGWDKVIFESYTSDGLDKIVRTRLGKKLMSKCFEDKAIIFATKRIGRTSGDARRILDTCRMAIDLAIEKEMTKVTPALINAVESQNFDLHRRTALERCSNLQKIILRCILREADGFGEDNVKVIGVLTQCGQMLKNYPFIRQPNISLYQSAIREMVSQRLICIECDKPFLENKMFIKNLTDSIQDLIMSFTIEQPKELVYPIRFDFQKIKSYPQMF